MLRREYLSKFKDRNPLTIDLDRQKLEDDNYVIDSNRPIKEYDIQNLPKEKLKTFVDKVLSNGKLNNVLYSSNASAVTKTVFKSTNTPSQTVNKLTSKEPPLYNIGKMRENREVIAQAQALGDKQLEEEYLKHNENIRKVKRLHFNINKTKNLKEDPFDNSEKYRKYRIRKVFEGIKDKLETISLPDVRLNLDNVYSRLYHNAVYLKTNSNSNSERLDTEEKGMKKMNINTPKYDLKVKNVLESSTGKEFTLKITDDLLMRCFSKHSGGPKMKYTKENDVFDLLNLAI
jgi:hypothetical protein